MFKISVIVPVYNVEEYLEECLESIVKQNYGNYEIVIVNDGSTDGSLKICKKYQKKYPKLITVYDKQNGGLSSARNLGIKKSTGDYLLFVDSDDYILPNCLEELGKYINTKNYEIVVYSFLTGKNKKYEMMYDNNIENIKSRYIVGKPCAPNKLCKKSLFTDNNIEFLNGVYYEDLATMPKLILKCNKIKFIDTPLYFYRIRENSIMNKLVYNEKMDSIFEVLNQLKEYFAGKYKEEIEYLYIEHLLRGASIRYIDCGNLREQLDKIVLTIKENYPNWQQNKYFKGESIKKKIMCILLYKQKYNLIKALRKINI